MRTNRIVITLLFLLACTPWVNAQKSSHWQFNIYEYEYDMSVFFELQLDGVPITDCSEYEVAAFVEEECRGVAEFQTATKKDGTKVQYGYLRVRSNKTEGETINFMVYHAISDKTYYSSETISFKNLEREGLPSTPFVISLEEFVVEDVDEDGNIDNKDMVFSLEKAKQKEQTDNLKKDGDSEACQQLIDKAKQDIDDYVYDNTKSMEENKSSLHKIVTQLESDLETQRKSDFDDYKAEQKNVADALAVDGDSEKSLQLITTAKNEIDAIAYDPSKTPKENKPAVDAIIEKLKQDLNTQREAEAADKQAFETYRNSQKESIDALEEEDDSEACKQIVADAKEVMDATVFDNNKTLEDNKATIDAIVSKVKEDLEARREAEATDKAALESYQEEQKSTVDSLLVDDDSEASKQIVDNAKTAIDAVTYDKNKTLEENKAIVDALINELKENLQNQREFESSIKVTTFTGTYDEQQHGINVSVPSGASVKYGERADDCQQDYSPVYWDAGTYVVYYEVTKEGRYPFKGCATVTIEKAQLTDMTLEQTEFTYDTFGRQPKTVIITRVKAGALDVPADAYEIEGDTETEIGNYTVIVTAKSNSNFTGVITANFTIVKEEINIDNQGKENDGENKDVKLSVTVLDHNEKTVRIDKLDIIDDEKAMAIPAQIRDYDVVEIADDAMGDETQITDVYLPDTKEAISIGKNALPVLAKIHTPLHLLDDYALMASLKPNYEATRISADAKPRNKYWTFSCGVDVILPAGLVPYLCKSHNNDGVIILELKDNTVSVDGVEHLLIKANNGILIASEDNSVGDMFEITARPSTARPSGMTPPTVDAKSYEGNELYPVIEDRHYNPSEWYILADNEFHELQLDDNSMVPACKAILPRKTSSQARTLSIYDGGATKIGTIILKDDNAHETWYDLQGRRYDRKPTKAGLYLNNGRKIVVK